MMFDEDLYGLGEPQTGPVSSTRAPGLEFQQGSSEAAGLFPRPTAPAMSMTPGGQGMQLPQQGGGGSNIGDILRVALPAIAAMYAMKKGSGLGSFTGGMQEQQQMQMRQDDQQAEQEFRQAQMERQQQMDARQMQDDEMRAQMQEQARREHHEQQMRQVLSGALSQAAENPNFMEMVNETGPEKYSINVPGMGNINLKAAFDQIGVVQSPEGKYAYGKPPASPKAPEVEKVQEYSYEDAGGNTVSEAMTPSERAKRGVLIKNKYKAPKPEKPEKPPQQRTSTQEEYSDGKVWSVTLDPVTGKELHRRVKRRMTERELQEQGGDDTGAAAPSGKDPLGIR